MTSQKDFNNINNNYKNNNNHNNNNVNNINSNNNNNKTSKRTDCSSLNCNNNNDDDNDNNKIVTMTSLPNEPITTFEHKPHQVKQKPSSKTTNESKNDPTDNVPFNLTSSFSPYLHPPSVIHHTPTHQSAYELQQQRQQISLHSFTPNFYTPFIRQHYSFSQQPSNTPIPPTNFSTKASPLQILHTGRGFVPQIFSGPSSTFRGPAPFMFSGLCTYAPVHPGMHCVKPIRLPPDFYSPEYRQSASSIFERIPEEEMGDKIYRPKPKKLKSQVRDCAIYSKVVGMKYPIQTDSSPNPDKNIDIPNCVEERRRRRSSVWFKMNNDKRCFACGRTFISKGSFRYHLSRCHVLSGLNIRC
ncbi:hypothetical protein HELRODRAFT_179856 [Helobdella robusta]|uniref:C2H2-type domain-containing protein n=1 Tax=Helobdella robusta TaxID=6412 RepID=T1FF77_HELRO|nr:hypothetical protein HELRODRAFT_179856 [Helobdella robusta]ESN95009.1 hypothetical protein HELRODRAFT_179856 [Helobdella robusta]